MSDGALRGARDSCRIAFDAAKPKDSIPASEGKSAAVIVWAQVFSVSSSGGSGPTCELELQSGTSMATPVVAGAAALVRPVVVLRSIAAMPQPGPSSNSIACFVSGENNTCLAMCTHCLLLWVGPAFFAFLLRPCFTAQGVSSTYCGSRRR